MTDLNDGESVEMKGSAATPYVIRNTGGVYSCSCPAWRNQSVTIEKRTCKHIRKLRGDDAENERIGSALPQKPVKKSSSSDEEAGSEPPILLAESWDNFRDLSGWWMSEKLDGVRAYWDGKQFLSRQGNIYHAPDWFLEGLPSVPLDGELWIDRKAFQRTVSIVRRQDKNDQWKQVRYLVFDAPSQSGTFEDRMAFLQDGASSWKNEFLALHQQILCRDVQHLRNELQRIESLGGEGLMLREPGSGYAVGRSSTLLKVKTFHDAEATVIGHEPGKGKHQGRLGALVVQLPNGKQFSVGTGFSDREREQPPTVGSLIKFRYQELSDGGIPRFPSYVGIRSDLDAPVTQPHADQTPVPPISVSTKPAQPPAAKSSSKPEPKAPDKVPPKISTEPVKTAASKAPAIKSTTTPAGTRRFEFVESGSSKFWEISLTGSDLTTRWGRIGSDGQTKTKTFPTNDKAQAEYNKLIEEKTGKGYEEVGMQPPIDPSIPAIDASDDDGDGFDSESIDYLGVAAVESGLGDLFERLGSMLGDFPDHPKAEAIQEFMESLSEESEDDDEDEETPAPPPLSPGTPASLKLNSVKCATFLEPDKIESLTKQIRKAGFGIIGDFTVEGLPISMRAFLRGQDTLAVISELPPIQWVELLALNADETVETWSSVPIHDGNAPPWSTFVQQPYADFNQLHTMMVEQRSDKEPGHIEASEFAEYFVKSYERGIAWRTSGQTAAGPPQASTKATKGAVASSKSRQLQDGQAPQSTEVSGKHLEIVQRYIKAYRAIPNARMRRITPKDVDLGKEILAMSPQEQIEISKAVLSFGDHDDLAGLREALLRKRLPYSKQDVIYLCDRLKDTARNGFDKALVGTIERWAESSTLPSAAAELLHQAVEAGRAEYWQSEFEALKTRVEKLACSGEGADERPLRIPISDTEVWANTAIRELEQMEASRRRLWTQLLQCCAEATSAKASDKWIQQVRPILESITTDNFFKVASQWLALSEKPQPEEPGNRRRYFNPMAISEINETILRGLIWCISLADHPDSPRLLGLVSKTMYRTVPRHGPRSQKIGNACVFALGQMSQMEAISQLAILKIKVKNGTAQRFIEGELNKAAERLNIPREALEEMSVPTYGLEEVGERREVLGDFTAVLTVSAQGDAELRWLKPDGTTQKSVPAALESDFAEDIKDLKTALKDVQKMVSVQRERIDSLALQRKSWTLAEWRERYLDHPVVGLIARRLLWDFQTENSVTTGCFLNGQMVNVDNQPIGDLTDSTQVRLWHPIGHQTNEIVQWRNWLEEHSITQPFRQAHREVYVLTDAERRTNVYSNRFAAHVLKQTQLRALAQTRGWHAKLLGYWDGGSDAQIYRYLPAWNITAQFWIQGVEPQGNDYGETAGMPYVTTDQVRFYSGQYKEYAPEGDLLPLDRVPELVLSEIMRDVDLFVGVSSIGNDPNWQDAGVRPFEQYWHTYSFGEISESASTRRDVLKRIIPRLKIADRCSFEDKFLIVRGDLRTYRIHFGSGNILMGPNDQYLCIVPKPVAESTVFLPFEGDRTLSIILSKALMLADDRKIKDPTILSQIQNR